MLARAVTRFLPVCLAVGAQAIELSARARATVGLPRRWGRKVGNYTNRYTHSTGSGAPCADTLNLIHDLSERGVGCATSPDPIKVDSSNPDDPMAQLAIVLLAPFGQLERTYTIERAAHARAVATARGRRIGPPMLVDPARLNYATHLRDIGDTIAEIVAKTGIARSSLYRHLPPRPAPTVTAGAGDPAGSRPDQDAT